MVSLKDSFVCVNLSLIILVIVVVVGSGGFYLPNFYFLIV